MHEIRLKTKYYNNSTLLAINDHSASTQRKTYNNIK